MSKHRHPPGVGSAPTRRDDKMSAEHASSVGPWSGSWAKMLKRKVTKKRRQRDREVINEDTSSLS